MIFDFCDFRFLFRALWYNWGSSGSSLEETFERMGAKMLSEGISREAATDARKFYEAWKLYETMTEGVKVIRSGFWMTGVYRRPPDDLSSLVNRGESDSEHEQGMAILADALYRWFPEVSPSAEHYGDVIYAALTHDIGEVKIGDLPDDGTRDEEMKVAVEREEMGKASSHMPLEDQWRFLYVYQCFELRDEVNADGVGMFLALCDKFESLLRLVRYERDGYVGRAGEAREKSERDADSERETGTDAALDVWTYAMVERFRAIKRPELFRTFFGILMAAVIEVRGVPFGWADELYEEFDVPIDDLGELIRQRKVHV